MKPGGEYQIFYGPFRPREEGPAGKTAGGLSRQGFAIASNNSGGMAVEAEALAEVQTPKDRRDPLSAQAGKPTKSAPL